MLSSTSNQQIKYLLQVKNKAKLRNEDGVFIAEGFKMVCEAQKELIKVYISESFQKQLKGDFSWKEYCDTEIVTDKVFREISDTQTPQGILALARQPRYTLEGMMNKDSKSFLLLEDLRDPGNLGTIMRTAEGAGIDGVILSPNSVDLFNPKVVRSTMGSIYRVPFYYAHDFYEAMRLLKEKGILLYGTHLEGKREYDDEPYSSRCGILIGNESRGLSQKAAQMADVLVRIPMEGRLESLNASVAAAIMMYELHRRRKVILDEGDKKG